jgi:hypothetical protein
LLSHLNNCLNVGSIGSEFISSKRKQATEKYLKSKPKDSTGEKKEKESQEREKSGANMCRLKNHDHAWSECSNNPISKNVAGKSYTEIPASERYANDFTKKA